MFCSDSRIRSYLESGYIRIVPDVRSKDIRPAGIRVHLSETLLVPLAVEEIDPQATQDVPHDRVHLGDEGYLLASGAFVLGATTECVFADRGLIGHIEGRSTLARLGLLIHCTSGVVDGIHEEARAIVLELKNLGPSALRLRAGMPIGMLTFSELTGPIQQPSQSQYRNQTGVRPPRLDRQLE